MRGKEKEKERGRGHFPNHCFWSYLKHESPWTSQLHDSVHPFFCLTDLTNNKIKLVTTMSGWFSIVCQGNPLTYLIW